MKQNCILPDKAEELKKAFKRGEISISKLFNTTAESRVDMLSKYIGKDNAKFFATRLEKAVISPRQKQAIKTVAMQMFGEKPLYSGVSIDQAKELSKLRMGDLKKMTDAERVGILSKYLDPKVAERLSTNFNNLRKTGNLHLWEEKTMGTKTLRESKRIKGTFDRLEVLDDMGVLEPKDLNSFMGNFVEDRLGVNLTIDQAQRLSKMTKEVNAYWDKIGDDWTYKNSKNVEGYLKKVTDLESYQSFLTDPTGYQKANELINLARANILLSHRIPINSILYQFIPTIERHVTKRVVPFEKIESLVDTIKAKAFSFTPNAQELEFIKEQLKMTTRIYHKTGIDISRLESLEDGYRIFGGERFAVQHGEFAAKNSFQAAINWIKKSPKWTAGGTDTLAAAVQRADTAIVMSKEIAFLEASKMKFKTSELRKEWIDKRAMDLIKESYSFNPKGKAKYIRAQGIFDAQMSNNTQKGGLTDIVVNLRNQIKIGGVDFGKLIVPFARIATKSIERGLGIALSPANMTLHLRNINKATKIPDATKRNFLVKKEVGVMIGNLTILGTAIVLASLLEDDDYIGPYSTTSYAEYELAKARGATYSSIKLGGKWVPIRYLPLVNIPLASIMTARQHKARGAKGMDVVGAYLSGMLGGILDTPLLQETMKIGDKLKNAASTSGWEKIIKSLGLDGKGLLDNVKVRALPSAISWDLWRALFPPETKYDFLGNETGKNRFLHIYRQDLSNDITLEFNRLFNTGNMPTVSDPKKPELVERLGQDGYIELLNRLKQNYADKVYKLMSSKSYDKLSDEEKKKEIDKLRKSEILDKLK